MSRRRLILVNLTLIVLLGLYGDLVNAPYWRANGLAPRPYEYLFWIGVFINGPSGFLADFLASLTSLGIEARYFVQYGLWCLFLWPQWTLYAWIVRQRQGSRHPWVISVAVISGLAVTGSATLYMASWYVTPVPPEHFIDRYFWVVRYGGLASAWAVIVCYGYLDGIVHEGDWP